MTDLTPESAAARPMHPEWARSLMAQCESAGVPFFMKQMSGRKKSERKSIPQDLYRREFPDVASP
jgi:protein gp37